MYWVNSRGPKIDPCGTPLTWFNMICNSSQTRQTWFETGVRRIIKTNGKAAYLAKYYDPQYQKAWTDLQRVQRQLQQLLF